MGKSSSKPATEGGAVKEQGDAPAPQKDAAQAKAYNVADYHYPTEQIYEGDVYIDMFYGAPVRDKIRDWKGDPSDVMLVAWPKTGITWTSQMLSLIINDGNEEKANAEGMILHRIEYMEQSSPNQPPVIDRLTTQDPPRVFKTHLKYSLLKSKVEQDKVKTIVVMRNPKDTITSNYHFHKMCNIFGNFKGSFDDFFELVKEKRLIYGDVFVWYRDWWVQRDQENVLILKYEDMIEDTVASARTIAKFIEKDLPDDVLKKVVDACSFKTMESHPATNVDSFHKVFNQDISKFYRKGKVGDWKNSFNKEQSDMVDKWCKEYLDPVGLTFDYE